MWQIIPAKESIVCEHCDHAVPEGQACLTEVPEFFSENTPPIEYRHFHIKCQECQADRSCYEMLASRNSPVRSKKDIGCTYCGHYIVAGQDLLWDYHFAPNLEPGDVGTQDAGVGSVGFLGKVKNPSFDKLSANFKDKFANAGLGRSRGLRTTLEAAEFYRSSVPSQVRNLGEEAVMEFTKGKQASHIESVMNAPSKIKSNSNLVWESAKNNMSRGSLNMTKVEQLGVHVKNGAGATRIVAKTATLNAGRAAGLAVLLEAPVSVAENVIYVAKGKKSREQAAKDTAKNVGKAGIIGGTVAVGITVAASFGAASMLAAAAPVVGAVGAGLFGISAFQRIKHAMQETESSESSQPLPSDTLPLFFHAACQECVKDCSCYELFAATVSTYSEKYRL